jgi:hypothetical protein
LTIAVDVSLYALTAGGSDAIDLGYASQKIYHKKWAVIASQAKPVLQGNHRSTRWHMFCKDGSPHNEERDEVSKAIGEDVKEHEETN